MAHRAAHYELFKEELGDWDAFCGYDQCIAAVMSDKLRGKAPVPTDELVLSESAATAFI